MDEATCTTSATNTNKTSVESGLIQPYHEIFIPSDFCSCVPPLSKTQFFNECLPPPVSKTRCSFKDEMRKTTLQLHRRQNRLILGTDVVSCRKLRMHVCLNDTDKVRSLLDSGVNPNTCDAQRRSPLHFAACKGYVDITRLLLQYGADPNHKDALGNTPLHLAACTNNIKIVTLLLDAGTDVATLDNSGRNPLQLAQSKLRYIRRIQRSTVEPSDVHELRDQVQQVITMMISFLQKRNALKSASSSASSSSSTAAAYNELDDLSDKLNKLKTSEIADIDVEVSRLLDDLQILEINKK